jgi:metal-responsive CopG/Arc/MetJ family transcriptional regulator
VKTAISLPDKIFFEAEEVARHRGITRSRLYAIALEEYLAKYNGEMITKKLNEVYDKINQNEFYKEFEPISNVALESLRELTKNDTW